MSSPPEADSVAYVKEHDQDHFIDGQPVMKKRRVSDASGDGISRPGGRFASSLKKAVSIEDSDSDDDDYGGAIVAPAKGYGHLLGRVAKSIGAAEGSSISGGQPITLGQNPNIFAQGGGVDVGSKVGDDGLNLGAVGGTPQIAAIRHITEDEFRNSRIIFNWPM